MKFPDIADVVSALTSGKPAMVWSQLVADVETPVSAALKLQKNHDLTFMLESVEGGAARGRYSIIGLAPDLIWRCFGNRSEINENALANKTTFEPCWEDSLSSIRKLTKRSEMELPANLPPMAAGLIGYFGYDMVKLMEHLPDKNPDVINIPDACFMRPSLLCIFDSVDGVVYLCRPIWAETERDEAAAKSEYDKAKSEIEAVMDTLQGPLDQRSYYKDIETETVEFTSNTSLETFHGMVEKAKDYINAGDIFQAVLSQRFSADFEHSPFALYRSLRQMNPSPFLFYLNFEGYQLVGSSPEILVRLRDEEITIRPIAGTRHRGATAQEDAALAEELLADEKERAEHMMLLDLGRNDVGRVAKAGTVKVQEKMQIEYYSHVMHIASHVTGQIDREKYDALDALIAGFPAGTVSGAPKIRAMEIIEELESERRSFYAGGVGYISANGAMDTCITLRTGLIKDGKLHIQAGGGVVADSSAEGEYQESWNKAKALMRAAEQAGRFA
jgi:anthranilate synthase component 1